MIESTGIDLPLKVGHLLVFVDIRIRNSRCHTHKKPCHVDFCAVKAVTENHKGFFVDPYLLYH